MHISLSLVTSLLPLLSLAENAPASTSAYMDAATGIQFQKFSASGMSIGLALPDGGNSPDLIAQMTGDPNTKWAGASLGPAMVGSVLIMAWPNEGTVQTSLRQATTFASPPVYAGATLTPIAKGTFVTETGWQATMLCKGCLANATLAFAQGDMSANMGYVSATAAPITPADVASPVAKHDVFGKYVSAVGAARSAMFATWAGMAA
ncbi:CBD9-like protein [Microthyrium microscopicum]|uniref:CBD9-like protein n=1 Tax=Microthyrium microscopicum TaxID=703497 RepID=A0A6A6UHT5_9PEZI|nr:CBD9-like protein [Microthyrium microscopicum]